MHIVEWTQRCILPVWIIVLPGTKTLFPGGLNTEVGSTWVLVGKEFGGQSHTKTRRLQEYYTQFCTETCAFVNNHYVCIQLTAVFGRPDNVMLTNYPISFVCYFGWLIEFAQEVESRPVHQFCRMVLPLLPQWVINFVILLFWSTLFSLEFRGSYRSSFMGL